MTSTHLNQSRHIPTALCTQANQQQVARFDCSSEIGNDDGMTRTRHWRAAASLCPLEWLPTVWQRGL
jgi:hypothetical protein